jgi:hypothetical protein
LNKKQIYHDHINKNKNQHTKCCRLMQDRRHCPVNTYIYTYLCTYQNKGTNIIPFLFTYLFSIKCLYYFISFSLITHVYPIRVYIRSTPVSSKRMGTLRSYLGSPRAYGPHANLFILCTASFLMFKHWFCWKYNKYMFNFIDHLHLYSCEWLCR